MAKEKAPRVKKSALNDLLRTLRRLGLCVLAAYGLYRQMPYEVLGLRLAMLWAVLYVASGLTELLFQYLSYRATGFGEMRIPSPNTATAGVTRSDLR